MATAITNEVKKSITVSGTVKASDKQVKGFNATIDTDNPDSINMSNWIIDQELYKTNRLAINEEIMKLENLAYAEQERLKTEVIK